MMVLNLKNRGHFAFTKRAVFETNKYKADKELEIECLEGTWKLKTDYASFLQK